MNEKGDLMEEKLIFKFVSEKDVTRVEEKFSFNNKTAIGVHFQISIIIFKLFKL